MSQPRIFVDGHVGTTGLRIREWLEPRSDVELLSIADAERKDAEARRARLNEADLVVLCLPDDAAREAVGLIENAETRVVDASTAHRVDDGWVYGLPEMTPTHREAVATSTRVSNPGCWPTTVILAVRPLVEEGLLPADAPVAVHGLSGYSGGGRSLIEKWEDAAQGRVGLAYEAPYAMERQHKHGPEMRLFSKLSVAPHFVPSVGPFRCGMRVEISLHAAALGGTTGRSVHAALADRYASERFVHVAPYAEPLSFDDFAFDPRACNDTNRAELHVVTHPDGHVLVVGLLDNLGKGAAGAAVQNLNLMLGLDEGAGLSA